MWVVGIFAAKLLDMSPVKVDEDEDSHRDRDYDGEGNGQSDIASVGRFLAARTRAIGSAAIIPFEEC